MKKIAFIASALALCAIAFTSCEDNNGHDVSGITEDGFYVAGAATGADKIASEYMMAAGTNEANNNEARDGMFEKYVALEGGKDFELVYYEAGKQTRYSAALEDLTLNGENDTPKLTIKRGGLVTGADAPAMKVEKSGLYHIVLDLNKANDLANPQIIVAPVTWGVRGVNGNWGWDEMAAGEFNAKTITFTKTYGENDIVKPGEFKFAYGGGWKIQLDDAGNVKANTNLGAGMVQGAGNIAIEQAYKGATITLTWTLKGGAIKNGYAYKIDGQKADPIDPANLVVGFSGGNMPNAWNDPADATRAAFDAAASTLDAKYSGTAVYKIADLDMPAGEFKVRFDGGWYGVGGATLTGITTTGTDNFILAEDQAGKYDVVFTVAYDGYAASKVSVAFTKK